MARMNNYKLTLRLPAALVKRLKKSAADEDVPLNELARQMFLRCLRLRKNKQGTP